MLTQLEAINQNFANLSIFLANPSNGYAVRNITGLSPNGAIIASSAFGAQNGSAFLSARRGVRNIVVTIDLVPNFGSSQSVQSLRTNLYKWFMPGSQVILKVHTSTLLGQITGRVESFESDLFTQNPSVTISILCLDPDFIGLPIVTTSGGTVSTTTTTTIDYSGTVPGGISLVVYIDRDCSGFTIYNTGPDFTTESFELAATLVDGDQVSVNTIPGQKAVTLNRSSVISSLLYGVAPQSKWLQFKPSGNNLFRVYATGASMTYGLTYSNRLGGM